MEPTAFLVPFELIVDKPGLDLGSALKVDGMQFSVETRGGGKTFAGGAPIKASKSGDAVREVTAKIQAAAAAAGFKIISLEVGSARPTGHST